MSRTRPILRWPGGKSRMLKLLLPMIPAHTCYCEPFVGGAAVLLAKERSKVEVINDVNGELIALYLNVQSHLPELIRQIDLMVNSRELFKLFLANPGLTELQRASRFLYRSRLSFAGNLMNFGFSKQSPPGFARKKVADLLTAMHDRLDNVHIENLSYERCLDYYDGPETFHFMDTPYVKAPTGAYDGWTEPDMRKFRKRVEKLKGKWLVTVNDSPLTRDLFADCAITPVQSQNRLCNNRVHSSATFNELIIAPS